MKILELFSGYGTASFALKRLNIPYELIGYSDIDKYANQCFKQNHCPEDVEDKLKLGDVTKIDEKTLPDFDLLTGGFPCQAFSVAGKMQGELDPRGTLFYEIIRIAEHKQPKYMLIENVKGLTTKKFKDTFDKILSELNRIGYVVYWKVLNTKDYGVPQSRDRVWFVCFRKDVKHSFQFPEKEELKIFLKDILEDEVNEKYYLSEKTIATLIRHGNKIINQECNPLVSGCIHANYFNMGGRDQQYCIDMSMVRKVNKLRIYDGISRTLNTTQGGGLTPLTSRVGKLRRLTPKECFRLQGFLNDEVNLEGLSDTQKYKLAGNGQSVNVVQKIFFKSFFNDYII